MNKDRYPWITAIFTGSIMALGVGVLAWKVSGGSIVGAIITGVSVGVFTGIITWNTESN